MLSTSAFYRDWKVDLWLYARQSHWSESCECESLWTCTLVVTVADRRMATCVTTEFPIAVFKQCTLHFIRLLGMVSVQRPESVQHQSMTDIVSKTLRKACHTSASVCWLNSLTKQHSIFLYSGSSLTLETMATVDPVDLSLSRTMVV